MEDAKIIRKCQTGDKEAFRQLVIKYQPFVYKFLVKISEDQDVAWDLTQDTFVKVIRNIEKFDISGSAKFSTYIITISRNLYVDYLRREKRIQLFIPIHDCLNIEDENMDIEDEVIDRMYNQIIMENIEKLTEEQKIVIKMKYIQGLTLKEIGEILNMEPKTIKSRIHNGIVKLRKMLERRE